MEMQTSQLKLEEQVSCHQLQINMDKAEANSELKAMTTLQKNQMKMNKTMSQMKKRERDEVIARSIEHMNTWGTDIEHRETSLNMSYLKVTSILIEKASFSKRVILEYYNAPRKYNKFCVSL